jgi:hypothetical protein
MERERCREAVRLWGGLRSEKETGIGRQEPEADAIRLLTCGFFV